jgi:predicted RNA-binding protein YlqC (UPF0109 family)
VSTDYAGLVEFIVKNIVENPEAVEVDGNSRRHRSQTVEVRLDPADVGRVIGKGGKNIEAIRAVVKAAAIKDHQRINVEVVTDDEVATPAETPRDEGGGEEPAQADLDEQPDGEDRMESSSGSQPDELTAASIETPAEAQPPAAGAAE